MLDSKYKKMIDDILALPEDLLICVLDSLDARSIKILNKYIEADNKPKEVVPMFYRCIAKCPELDCVNSPHCTRETFDEYDINDSCPCGNEPNYVRAEKRILECSSAGDKRFSAFHVKVNAFGKIATIESHYQSCKRKYTGDNKGFVVSVKKGEKVDFCIINSHKLEPRFLTQWYKLLWIKYLDSNKDLVEFASSFDNFNDKFKGKATNCQADVIRQYVKRGRASLMEDCKELLTILRG